MVARKAYVEGLANLRLNSGRTHHLAELAVGKPLASV